MAGRVYSGEQKLEKPGHSFADDIPLEVRGGDHPWVSRGGVKLAHALDEFEIRIDGCVALDIGASTGGFTDVLLSRGAAKVYAVDVGRGQLAWRLQSDDRVVRLERTNARRLSNEQVPEPVDIVTCDASFIGLRTILPAPLALVRPGGVAVALIKPQFEVGRERVGKRGIVRDLMLHTEVCEAIRDWFADDMGWEIVGITESPIQGADGNVEFLIAARRPAENN